MPPRVYRGLALGAVSMVSRVGCPDGAGVTRCPGPAKRDGRVRTVSPLEAQGRLGPGCEVHRKRKEALTCEMRHRVRATVSFVAGAGW